MPDLLAKRSKSDNLVRMAVMTALFTALNVLCTRLQVPMVPVPAVLTQVSLLLAGGLLGSVWGTGSALLYLVLGAIGLPVFASGGGLSRLLGPTGGFLWGYPLAALVVGLAGKRFGKKWYTILPFCVLGCAVIYVPGIAWMMVSLNLTLTQALAAGALPFLPGDALKAVLCAVLLPKLRSALRFG